ncbi:PUL-domain-containing protein, partial [Tilletiaria anomala UBC 951]
EYDYVFDVDVTEGAPPLKLPFNLGENPYFAAQRFIDQNELSQAFLGEIVKFIDKNTDQQALAHASASTYIDPYTGAGRYTGASPSALPTQQAVPKATGGYSGSGNLDPYTRSTAAAVSSISSTGVLPLRTPLGFKQLNPAPVKAKIQDLADAQGGLSGEELSKLNSLIDQAAAAKANPALDVGLLEKLLQAWPPASRFPLLDVYRIAASLPTTSSTERVIGIALDAASWSTSWPAQPAEVKERDTNSMLALRALANLLTRKDASQQLLQIAPSLIEPLSGSHFSKLGKNGRIAFATLTMNLAVAVNEAGAAQPWATDLLRLFVEILSAEDGDSEVVYRSMMGLGTLIRSSSSVQLSVETL